MKNTEAGFGQMTNSELIDRARAAAAAAHAPYSGVRVGAVLVGASGRIYTGANVENASYGVTICAERACLAHAVNEGETVFRKLVVYSPSLLPVPCGACLQFMSEFFRGREQIIVVSDRAINTFLFRDLFPHPFALRKP